jgi:Family of unknown function (DUF6788)
MTEVKLSELSVAQLRARRRRLVGAVSDPERTLRGAVLHESRRCSSEGCRCRRGELHGPYTYLAVYLAGRSRMVYVPQALAELATEHVELTQRNEALLGEISQINLELLRRRALE